jgi:ribosomal protein L4
MSMTGDVLIYETRPMTIAGMVTRIREKRELNPRHRAQSQDSIPTDIITQIVYSTGDLIRKGIRQAKHRAEPTVESMYKQSGTRFARHLGLPKLPWAAPGSLFELITREDI